MEKRTALRKVNRGVEQHTGSRTKGSVTIPYVKGVSESLRRVYRKRGVAVHFKPFNSIRSLLVKPKDKIGKGDKVGVVYQIKCHDCDNTYVGESGRALKTRIVEHKRPNSTVATHAKDCNHSIDYDGVQILDQDTNWHRRGIKESIHIRIHGSEINRDQGRHHLPTIYNSLLKSGDTTANQAVSPD